MKPMSDKDYQAQADMHTLLEAHAIKKDKKRHAAAKAHAKKKLSGMKAMVDDPEDMLDGGKDEVAEGG